MTTTDLRLGDCIETMRQLPANSVDSIVTDPPYELGFMGKSWDSTGIAYNTEMWIEALRVLKLGGHLLAFSGSRTYHRMACAIEDAGFEIRDQIMWVYGSGFPKSLDVSKAIDKQAGSSEIGEPTTDKAKQWAGWGTALKPAHEPIVMARKPLIGTVATNVIIHGTGALNIDGSRVQGLSDKELNWTPQRQQTKPSIDLGGMREGQEAPMFNPSGRWPANFIHDGSDEVVELFPDTGKSTGGRIGKKDTSGVNIVPAGQYEAGDPGYGDSGSAARFFYCAKASKKDRNAGLDGFDLQQVFGDDGQTYRGLSDSKLPSANHHPTVKPTDLMRYLVKLVTPPNGTVLDPFTGSGSTGKAAMLEGFNFIGCELDPDYLAIAKARIKHALDEQQGKLL